MPTKQSIIYSAGHRCYYWPYYQKNEGEWNILYTDNKTNKKSVERLMDWFISIKYGSFEDKLSGIKPFEGLKPLTVSNSKKEFIPVPYLSECNILNQ